ncbi:hypothetical protein BCR33DRAFT_715027 [Rhizoclosmatium globosum]|uniref:Uncharacterized protein n=1 Tax=Rhizoclosmatium globosum TaxID=329046 RepID=A0A1Y2CJV8_9FUNG|nr:hypothetical protein BCR33DRAFT_715027 [Rhizoclosmatium globosum]|eukprot:ORY47280.1 hypothetical protein BCR33DRAFT_715027 [Rhizoclosmatium globosum]
MFDSDGSECVLLTGLDNDNENGWNNWEVLLLLICFNAAENGIAGFSTVILMDVCAAEGQNNILR